MKKEPQKRSANKRFYRRCMTFLFLLITAWGSTRAQNYGTPTRYEAENGFNSGVTTASAYSGYSGTGYVTGLTTNNSETKFDAGVNSLTPTKVVIRYANGSGATVTNLALYVGSNAKVQDLLLPATGSWSTWSTITVTFNHDPSWGSNIIIKSTSNVTTSANIDCTDLSIDDGTAPATATPAFSPAGGTYTSAQSVSISSATSGATIYYTTDNSTPTITSTVYSAPISVGVSKTINAIAAKPGMSISAVASAAYTINLPPPVPGAFTQTAPAAAATGIPVTPTFSWGASSNATGYALVVSTNSTYASPVINVTGLTGTSYTPGTALAGNTKYYWKVTASNSAASTVAGNAGIFFTTLTPPAPGAFTQTAPATGATSVSAYPAFAWAASSSAASYTLVVSTSSSYSNPVINVAGLTGTSYLPTSPLAVSTLYYWKVTAVNGTGNTVATNAGISFTTAATTGTTYYVAPGGTDAPANGTSANPWKTLAYAAAHVPAGTGNTTISLAPGTYVETACTLLPLGVNIVGAGTGSTIITANGALPTPGVDQTASDYHLWADGSLIQLKSPIYSGANPRYGDPSLMIAPENGSQTLSGFSIDGHSKTVKVGVWVENRNNVTMHHVNFTNLQQSGAVFSRGDMYYYTPLPDGKWMLNSLIHDCAFTTAGSTSGGEQVGNLCLGGLDGAEVYNVTINDPNGEGIKFEHVGHFRNTKIHDCTITVGETDPSWGEKMSMELWNLSYNNEVYNINCNTWLSMVNQSQFDDYQPTAQHPSNLKIHNVNMIDGDGVSAGIESIECALSGVEIYNCYFQDKGFGIAIWGGAGWGGDVANHNESIHNNIFAKVNTPATFGFGNSAAVFVPDAANTIKIYNNVFDGLGNSLQLDNATGVDIKNNIFQNSHGDDIQGGSSLTIQYNLRYNTDPQKPNWVVSGTLGTGNIQGNPGLLNTGNRFGTYYQPASAGSFVVDKGVNVGFPYVGAAPDIGRWEYGATGGQSAAAQTQNAAAGSLQDIDAAGAAIQVFPNPTRGAVRITAAPGTTLTGLYVTDAQGKIVLVRSAKGAGYTDIDLGGQPAGIYLISIDQPGGKITKKLILVK